MSHTKKEILRFKSKLFPIELNGENKIIILVKMTKYKWLYLAKLNLLICIPPHKLLLIITTEK